MSGTEYNVCKSEKYKNGWGISWVSCNVQESVSNMNDEMIQWNVESFRGFKGEKEVYWFGLFK